MTKEERREYVKRRAAEAIANGLCRQCNDEPIAPDSKSRCVGCLAVAREAQKIIDDMLKAEGRCRRCRKKLPEGHDRVRCPKCLAKETGRKRALRIKSIGGAKLTRIAKNRGWGA